MSGLKRTILSGIQPTGVPHLGNYLGALRSWVNTQDSDITRTLYSVVDLHAITVPHQPNQLRQDIYGVTASLLACGLDPQRTTLFQQSHVREHSELAWLLSCRTPLGWLNRMTQFKDKSSKGNTGKKGGGKGNNQSGADAANLGLYSYPVLMAADILLYRATHVPVGDDQRQHLELARDIASSFNHEFLDVKNSKHDIKQFSSSSSSSSSSSAYTSFPLPETLLVQGSTARVMSLKDGSKKMSKSDKSILSRIDLTDDTDTIVKKIKKAKTDSIMGNAEGGWGSCLEEDSTRYEVRNLIGILSALKQIDEPEQKWNDIKICQSLDARNATSKDLKDELTDALVTHICPIGENINRYMQDKEHLSTVLKEGGDKAREVAQHTMEDVRRSMGLV